MIRKLYDWTLSFAQTKYALWILILVAFAESSFFPIPPEVLLIPMIIALPSRAFTYAALCTLASVAGGLLGYYIGAALFQSVALPILEFYHVTDKFDGFADRYNAQGHWAVLIGGLSPFPYKVITITSGATELPLSMFLSWSIIARGVRYFIIALLLWKFGIPIKAFIERYLGLLFGLFLVLLIGGFYLVKFL